MADEGTTTTTTTTGTTATTPWYEGKADAETVGHWQNKGWKTDDPAAIAIEATKAAREAQKLIGVPPEQILRLPAKPDDEAGWKAVYSRLGVPNDPKEYSFDGIKYGDGSELEASFTDAMRAALVAARVPKDHAGSVVKAVIKQRDDARTEEAAAKTAKLAVERVELEKNWGPNKDFNKLTAMNGARRLGVTPEAVAAMENQLGYAATMEMFRKVGAGTSEDTFHGGTPPLNGPMTREAAISRKAELMADSAWRDRYLNNSAPEKREMINLNAIITGDTTGVAA